MRDRAAELDLEWVPRDQNEEADALANEDFGAFDPGRRVDVKVEYLQWQSIPEMLRVSEDIYKDLKARREAHKAASGAPLPKLRPQERLRVRDRW